MRHFAAVPIDHFQTTKPGWHDTSPSLRAVRRH